MRQNTGNFLPKLLEKARQIAKELTSYGATAVILSGSAARGKKNLNDLDFLVFGKLEREEELKKVLSEKYEIPIQLFVFTEEYLDSLIKTYKTNKDWLSVHFVTMAQEISGRHLSWPLIPLLSDEEFQDLFRYFFLPGQRWHPYLTKEHIVFEGRDYIEAKRKELNAKEEVMPKKDLGLLRIFRSLLSFKKEG